MTASGCGRSRTSRSTSSEPRTRPGGSSRMLAQVALEQARASGSWRTVVAPPASIVRSSRSAARSSARCSGRVGMRSPRPRRPGRRPTSRSSRTGVPRPGPGRTTSASTCTTCPRSRTGSPRSSVAPRGSSSARGSARCAGWSATSRAAAERLVWEDDGDRGVRAVRVALAVRGLGRAAPPRGGLRAGRATPTSPRRPRRCARCSAGWPGSTARPTTSSSIPRRSREQVDATYHWHWEIHPRLREIAGLELGTGLPVNPVSPEEAVEELLGDATAVGATEATG